MERGRGVQVEAEVPDVGAAPGVDDHVVAVEGGERGEIGGDGEATRVETEEAPVGHRYDQQAAVGEPAEPRRLTWHLDHGLRSSGEVDRHHAMRVHVREPELPRMPSRALGEDETIEEHPGRGRHALHSARCAAAGNGPRGGSSECVAKPRDGKCVQNALAVPFGRAQMICRRSSAKPASRPCLRVRSDYPWVACGARAAAR